MLEMLIVAPLKILRNAKLFLESHETCGTFDVPFKTRGERGGTCLQNQREIIAKTVENMIRIYRDVGEVAKMIEEKVGLKWKARIFLKQLTN